MTRQEQETTVNFYGDSKRAGVYTCMPRWHRELERLCRLYPEECRLERSDGVGYWYTIPADYFRPRPKRRASLKQKEHLAAARAKIAQRQQDKL